jgi:hypothetical protein
MKRTIRCRRRWPLVALCGLLSLAAVACGDDDGDVGAAAPAATTGTTAKAGVQTFPPGTEPLGRSPQDWLSLWWEFLFSGDDTTNPATNTDACASWEQTVAGVFVLPHVSAGETVEVSCTVPAGTPILAVPGASVTWDETVEKVEPAVDAFAETKATFRNVHLVVDGQDLGDVEPYYTEVTEPRPLVIPALEGEPFGPAGDFVQVSQGWPVVLQPLAPGEHTIVLSDEIADTEDDGTTPETDASGQPTWSLAQYTVHLTVTA